MNFPPTFEEQMNFIRREGSQTAPSNDNSLDLLILKTFYPKKRLTDPDVKKQLYDAQIAFIKRRVERGDNIASERARELLQDKEPELYAAYTRLEGGRRKAKKGTRKNRRSKRSTRKTRATGMRKKRR